MPQTGLSHAHNPVMSLMSVDTVSARGLNECYAIDEEDGSLIKSNGAYSLYFETRAMSQSLSAASERFGRAEHQIYRLYHATRE